MGKHVDLYVASTSTLSPREEAAFTAVLDEDEMARAYRLKAAQARRDFTIAHGLCRFALSRAHPAISPGAWRFRLGLHGKPEPDGVRGLTFSLTHTAGLVAVAVSEGREVGVDAEAVVPALATMDTARIFCTQAELEVLEERGTAVRTQDFFALWTLKESLLKATGRGLLSSPQAVECGLDPLCVRRFKDSAPGGWRSWTADMGGAHRLAVTVARSNGEPFLSAYEIAGASDLLAGDPPQRLEARFMEVGTVAV